MWPSYVIAVFYLFCIADIALLLWFMHLLSRSKFRSEDEGSTVQVGYEEDPQGEVIPTEIAASNHEEAQHAAGEAIMHMPRH